MKATKCRSCHSDRLELIHDFGPQPLAGYFPRVPNSQEAATRYPLDLTQCRECTLLQVTNLPPIDEIFHDEYCYASSTVPDLVRHFQGYADQIVERLPAGASVLEFGSNDGVLLHELQRRGFTCVGVDASENVADMARGKGLDVRTGFFTQQLVAEQELAGRFDLVTCSNVFAHIDNIRDTTAAVRDALKPGGLFTIEVHDGEKLAEEAQFDTIYHEHLTYFTEASLRHFVEHEGFEFVGCDRTPMHGGGLRLTARMLSEGAAHDAYVAPQSGMIDGDSFTDTIERCAADIRALVAEHGLIDGYGAAGRAQMFVNMTSTGDCFARVFDDSALRRGRFIVGTDIPIQAYADHDGDGACAILAWNYAATIADRIRGSYAEVVTVLPVRTAW